MSATGTKSKKKTQIIARRLPHFLVPEEVGKSNRFHIQAALADGELKFIKTTQRIWEAVRGDRYGADDQYSNLGLRRYSACDFLIHLEDEVATRIDVIPSRYHTRGAAPRCALAAQRKGITLLINEACDGYEVINENLSDRDREDHDFLRIGYLGLTQNGLVNFLVAFHESGFQEEDAKTITINDHQCTKVEDGRIRVVPKSNLIKTKTKPRGV